MSNDIKAAIRKALAGSSSQQPVDGKKLQKIGPDVIDALNHMQASREINSAMVTRNGASSMLYWLTGAALPIVYGRDPRAIVAPTIIRPEASHAAATTPTTPINTKESTMPESKGKSRSPLYIAVIDLVTEQPGITHTSLCELALLRAKGSTEEQALKMIQNLLHTSKKIRAEGKRSDRCFFLTDAPERKQPENSNSASAGIPGPSAATRKKLKKLSARKNAVEAKPAVAPAPQPGITEPMAGEASALSISLQEDNHILIRHCSVGIALDASDAMRVASFIKRVYPVVMPA